MTDGEDVRSSPCYYHLYHNPPANILAQIQCIEALVLIIGDKKGACSVTSCVIRLGEKEERDVFAFCDAGRSSTMHDEASPLSSQRCYAETRSLRAFMNVYEDVCSHSNNNNNNNNNNNYYYYYFE